MKALLIDIGNSRVKARVADLAPDSTDPWNGATHVVDAAQAERIAGLPREAVEAVLISNVASVDRGDVVVRAVAARWPRAQIEQVASRREQGGVVNAYREPAQLGVDRWMALLGARGCLPQQSALVCSFGTATTIDLLVTPGASTERPAFVGGLILPGFETMRTSLSGATARLPLGAGQVKNFADRTDDAIASGILTAQAGAVERALRQAMLHLATLTSPRPLGVVVTGGHAPTMIAALTELSVPVVPIADLVLHGMRSVASERWTPADTRTTTAAPA